MSRLFPVYGLASVLVLAACSDPRGRQNRAEAEPEVTATVEGLSEVRACDSGATVAIEPVGQDQIRLTYKDQSWTLTRVPAGQGLHYSAPGVDWSVVATKGEEVGRLSRVEAKAAPVILDRCRRPAPQLAEAPAARAMKPCITPDLIYGVEAGDAAMGHRLTTIRVENRGTSPCELDGNPRVSLVGQDDRLLDQVKADAKIDGYFGRIRAGVPLLLQAGDKAYFDLGWGVIPHEDKGEKTCPQAKAVRLAPPGDTGGRLLPLAIQACDNRVEVSPYRGNADRQTVSQAAP